MKLILHDLFLFCAMRVHDVFDGFPPNFEVQPTKHVRF